MKKMRIAHLSGPNATITNTPPLVTSNKARQKYGLPLQGPPDAGGTFDVLRPQKLATPAVVYVEQFSAHPLESDAAELYGPPDGYIDAKGSFSAERRSDADKPVYEVIISPEDGYYPLPYMARQFDGSAWEGDAAYPDAPRASSRQPFFPDGRRLFEEIDQLGIGTDGRGSLISRKADVDFYRVVPSGGYTKGASLEKRSDYGVGDIPPEESGRDFFPYRPRNIQFSPPRMALSRITNIVQRTLASGKYDGAIWTQGSPRIEETVYWLNLILDVKVPLCGNAAQRYHGMISADGDKNITDSLDWIASRAWADENGFNKVGVVLVQEQRVFAAREVTKGDARPGGYTVAGGHGGVIGSAAGDKGNILCFIPNNKHTFMSEVNITNLPLATLGYRTIDGMIEAYSVTVKAQDGDLLETAVPKVSIIKDVSYSEDDWGVDADREVDVKALMDVALEKGLLSGFVIEGLSPYGRPASSSRSAAMRRAVFSGFPVVHTGRGNTQGFAASSNIFIGGSNLTATKARMLLMLCIIKFGMLPRAVDPTKPTKDELVAVEKVVKQYQAIFNTH